MRGRFSIEWLAQSSSSSAASESSSACGTRSESLPGFYCRTKPESPDPQHRDAHYVQTKQEVEAGFSSGTEEETSGYESEGGRSLSPAAPADSSSTAPPSPPSGRRPRTAFTAEQISSLEKAFKRNAYLGTEDKAELCRKLNLSDKQIRNWFQNRRMKLKRTVQDALAHACQANVTSHFMHYPELQAYRPAPYPRYHHSTQEGPAPATAPYVHPHGLQYSAPLPADSLYQYNSVMLPSATAQLMGSYPPYPQYY